MAGKHLLCQTVQKGLLEDDGQLHLQNQDAHHVESCEECRVFLAHLRLIRGSIQLSDNAPLPHPEIIRQLKNRFKEELRPVFNLRSAIQSFLNYPIPAYQVLGGIILILFVTFGYRIASESGQSSADMNDSFYLADSTHDPAYSLGESVYEDTIWVQHMVTF